MGQMIAYCGLDCGGCPVYVATQANDLAAQERMLAEWRVQFNLPDLPLTAVLCDSCRADGRHCGYCGVCQVRACAAGKGVANCAHCVDYGCEQLEGFLAKATPARTNLEGIRQSL